jgi:hypothetical protein
MTGIAGSHHVLGVEHLLRQFGNRQRPDGGQVKNNDTN